MVLKWVSAETDTEVSPSQTQDGTGIVEESTESTGPEQPGPVPSCEHDCKHSCTIAFMLERLLNQMHDCNQVLIMTRRNVQDAVSRHCMLFGTSFTNAKELWI